MLSPLDIAGDDDSQILGRVHCSQDLTTHGVEFGDRFSPGDVQDLAFAWIEAHPPPSCPLCEILEVPLEYDLVFRRVDLSVYQTVVREKSD